MCQSKATSSVIDIIDGRLFKKKTCDVKARQPDICGWCLQRDTIAIEIAA
jgi:hypothetical protein